MARMRRVGDDLQAQGVDNPTFFMSEAAYHSLAGNVDAGLEWLDRAVTRGFVAATPRIAREWPALAALEGDPGFELIQQRMIEHLNAERAELGLDPVEA